MIHYFLEDKRLYLREVHLTDVNDSYCRWMNDPEVVRYTESRFKYNSIESIRSFVNDVLNDDKKLLLAVILKETHQHIGNIKLCINWVHRSAEIGLIIGEKSLWKKGYASDAILLMVKYAFNTLNLHRLTAGCYEPNHGSCKAFQKAGFEIEGTRKKALFCEGDYVDSILLRRTIKVGVNNEKV